jgi:penicillin-binding protein 1A
MLFETLLSGTGKSARLAGRPAAGKTGTSQNFRDAWFVGYTPELIAGVWMGNDDGAAMDRVTGGAIPARAWREFMTAALAGVPASSLPGTGEIPVLEPFVPVQSATQSEEANAFERLLDAITSEIGPDPAAASD